MTTASLAGVAVTAIPADRLAGQPHPERCVELGFPQVAIAAADQVIVGPLHLRTTPMEAIVLALTIEAAVGAAAMAEARRLRAHGPAGADTGVLIRIRDRLRDTL